MAPTQPATELDFPLKGTKSQVPLLSTEALSFDLRVSFRRRRGLEIINLDQLLPKNSNDSGDILNDPYRVLLPRLVWELPKDESQEDDFVMTGHVFS
jgi:hypothetical protein